MKIAFTLFLPGESILRKARQKINRGGSRQRNKKAMEYAKNLRMETR